MKHPRLRKILKWGSLGLLVLVLLLGLSVWFLAGTDSGTEFLFTRLGAVMPGKLEVADMKGPLRGPLDIQGLKYEREGFTVYVDRLHLQWRLRDLLNRQLDIQQLHADGIRIVTTPSEEEKERTPLPDINLRFNIIVRDAKVRNLSFASSKPEPGQTPFVIDSIDLETTAIQSNVRVDRLAVRSSTFNADVDGTVRPQGAYPVDLNVRWSLRLPDMAEMGGRGKLSGTLEDLQVDQTLNAPFPVQAKALLQDPLYDMRFDGRVRFSDANPRLFQADLPDIPASGEVALKGSITDFTGIGTVEATLEQTGPVSADFQVTRDDLVWIVDRAAIALTGTPTRLTAEGRIDTEGETPSFQGVAGWENLTWPLRSGGGGEPVVASRRGTARIDGSPEKYNARVQADLAGLAGGKVPPGSWTIAGQGTQERFRFDELAGNIFGGRLTGRGEVAWKPDVRWNATVRAAGIDPGQLAEGFPGRLSLAARTQGRLEDAGPFGSVEVTSLQGILRGQPVQAVAGLRLAGSRHEITRLNATWSTAKLSAAGWVGDALDLRWTLDAPNLAIAVPQGAGAVTAEGRVSGPAATPRIQADARGADLRFGTQTISEVTAVADVDLAPNGTVVLDVTSRGIQSGERRIEELLLQGRGTRGNHTITATARNADGTLGLALAGGLATPTDWRGQIRQLDLRSEMTGDWSLTQPAPLAASTDAVQVQDFCWRSRDGQLCATGGWAKAGDWNVDSRVSDLSFDLFKTFLPPDLEITGQLNGTVRARGNGSVLASADVDLRPGPGELRFPGKEGRTLTFRYEQGSVRAVAGAGGAGNATAHMTLVGVGTLDAQARLPRFAAGVPLQGQLLAGRIDVQLNDIAFLEGFVPDLNDPKGALTAGYTLAGTVGRPLLTGEARLANGSANVPRFGLKLREIRLAAIGDGSGSLDLDVSAKSGPGTVTMKGRTGLVPSKENPVQLAVKGQRFQAMDTEKIKVLVSPDLQIAYAGDLIRVTGDLDPGSGRRDQGARQEGAGQRLRRRGLRQHHGRGAGRPEGPPGRHPRPPGARPRRRGQPFRSRSQADRLAPRRRRAGQGHPRRRRKLELKEGTFKAYGQDLTIERGRLVFAGPIDNPGVDIRAYRKADDGTVAGINAKGTARKPEVTLWSRPAMTESETLSYLLLGRPLNRVQPQEDGDRLANAATSLGIKGGNLLAKKLAARYGLEEAKFESEDGSLEQASLVVGKYLSPRLYVGYGIGLFEAVNTFRIRYLINDKWNLQAESGEGTSADILYTVERGKK